MTIHQRTTHQRPRAEHRPATFPSPPDWWMLGVRLLWPLLAVVLLGGFVASVPVALQQFQRVCSAGASCPAEALTPGIVDALGKLGLTPAQYAGYRIVLESLSVTGWFLVATVLFWRRA